MSDAAISADRVLVMAGSSRIGSLNAKLARLIARRLAESGESVGLVDLADYVMPLYNGDLEDREGAPSSASQLCERFLAAEAVVLVCPEYNRTFTPLLKNTIDWMSRVESKVLAHLTVLLASASPGSFGGARSVAMVRQWMGNLSVNVAEHALSIAKADVDADGNLTGVGLDGINKFVEQARKPS